MHEPSIISISPDKSVCNMFTVFFMYVKIHALAEETLSRELKLYFIVDFGELFSLLRQQTRLEIL